MATVLVVEDDRRHRFLVEEELRRDGHATRSAGTATAALAAVATEMPDLVVLDIGLPGMAAFDLLGKLLGISILLPVVIYTDYEAYRDSFTAWAADAFLIKQPDFSELKATIRRALAQRQSLGAEPEPRAPVFASAAYDQGCPAERELVAAEAEGWELDSETW